MGVTGPPDSLSEEAAPEETVISSMANDDLMAHSGLVHRNLSQSSSLGEAKLGRIQLTLRYSVPRQKLVVVVHKIS